MMFVIIMMSTMTDPFYTCVLQSSVRVLAFVSGQLLDTERSSSGGDDAAGSATKPSSRSYAPLSFRASLIAEDAPLFCEHHAG